MRYFSSSALQTKKIASTLAKSVKGGDIIGLIGDLGAGKTTFARWLINQLGVKGIINSPTFVLMKIYCPKKQKLIKNICHIDAYRLSSKDDFLSLGVMDYFKRPDTVIIIEWADKIKKYLPKKQVKYVRFRHTGVNQRLIVFQGKDFPSASSI